MDVIDKMMAANERVRERHLYDDLFDNSQEDTPCNNQGFELNTEDNYGIRVSEIGLSDLQEQDYPTYCRVYHILFERSPAIIRQAW